MHIRSIHIIGILILLYLLYFSVHQNNIGTTNLATNSLITLNNHISMILPKKSFSLFMGSYSNNSSYIHTIHLMAVLKPLLNISTSLYFYKIFKLLLKNIKNSHIRTSGGHHTFMDISLTNDTMIRTLYLKKVLHFNQALKHITVESGILLDKINNYLWNKGLALHIQPAIPWQSIAGAVSTATHGSEELPFLSLCSA